MNKYKCLIADDNLLERDALAMHLGKLEQVHIVAVCEDGHEALKVLQKEEGIDIVLSDVEMPNLSGFELLRSLKEAPVFIFISSHGEFAIESYNLDVVDFIVKPVTFPRVMKAVNKAIEYIELKRSTTAREAAAIQNETYFFIRENNDLVKLDYESVAYIESMGDFSKIFTTDDKKHITLVSLKNLELQLPSDHFTRIHKQHIINHHHISAITTDDVKIAGRYLVPLSQSFRQELMDKVVNKKIVTRHIKN